jgi:hypothetical protein
MKMQKTVALTIAALAAFSVWARQGAAPSTQAPAKQPEQQPVKNEPEKKAPRKRVVTDLSGFDLLDSGKQPMVAGATRSLPRPVALAPRLGKLYGAGPLFAWRYEGAAGKFVFVLADELQKEVFQAEVAGTQFRYPKDAPGLLPGKTYFWTVEVSLGALGSVQSTAAGILMASSDQRAEVEKALSQVSSGGSYEQALGRARVFTKYRLWYDAVSAYSDLIARFPSRAELYEERGTIYAQLEATRPLAEQDFARAEAIVRAPR